MAGAALIEQTLPGCRILSECRRLSHQAERDNRTRQKHR
jgi:hypothetical protein